jgi:Phage capsid protein
LSTSIDLSFVKQFEREVHEAYRSQGSLLRTTVRSKNIVKGASTTFQKIGKGVSSTKARPLVSAL